VIMVYTSEENQIGEIVSALSRFAPTDLADIAARHPDHRVLFTPGMVLGDGIIPTLISCDVTLALLSRYSTSSVQLLRRMRRRLHASWWFDLIAKLTATGGAGGTIAAFLGSLSINQGIAAGLVSLTGSACSLIFSLLQRDAAGGSLIASYNKLVEAMAEAEQQQRVLQVLCPQGPTKDLNDAVNRAEQLARLLNEMALRYG